MTPSPPPQVRYCSADPLNTRGCRFFGHFVSRARARFNDPFRNYKRSRLHRFGGALARTQLFKHRVWAYRPWLFKTLNFLKFP